MSRLLTIVLALAPLAAHGESFYQPGFSYTLKGADAPVGLRDATQVGPFLIGQVGTTALVAINVESGTERWRYTAKAIRKMTVRSGFLLVEAEQLVALDPNTGFEKWAVPLNCYSDAACNTRVRSVESDAIVLTGFDGKDDNLMLVDPANGQRLWPTWVAVPQAKLVVYTSSTVVVASGIAPYAVLGLDRYTGRERWKLRPEGTESAASGLVANGDTVTAWWSSKSADLLYSVDLESGAQLADWVVGRNVAPGARRGGGPGFFYAWSPSLVDTDGQLRTWNPRTGAALWQRRYTLLEPPEVRGATFYAWLPDESGSQAFVAIDATTGTERWRYVHAGVTGHTTQFQGATVILRLTAETPIVVVLHLLTGKVEGAGALPAGTLAETRLTQADRQLFLIKGPSVQRFDPLDTVDIESRFNDHIQNGQLDEAKKLHALVRPFVEELPAAARIHRLVLGQSYQDLAAKMQSGSFASMLPAIERLAGDGEQVNKEDFRGLVMHVKGLMTTLDTNAHLSVADKTRLVNLTRRFVVLVNRFERQLSVSGDKELFAAMRDVLVNFSNQLQGAGESADAHHLLYRLWKWAWIERGPDVERLLRQSTRVEVKRLLPAYQAAVQKGDGQDAALLEILDIGAINLVLPEAPDAEKIPDMSTADFAALLEKLKAAVK